ncbi:MAG: recombinase family protein [Patescibacteria group bacterium]
MKKAVYYARVSTSLQENEGTIESQKSEIIRQIKKDGNILVKEYIDNGWSGGRLDRPALDELREDLKTDQFEVVYFIDSDRIARDVSYQNIIIAELLKYQKEIIIKGKNYINNPENKFNLNVMGAFNEYEKAKITERFMRGRRERARQGHIVDSGGLFGYDHHKKTDSKRGYYTINEEQAEVVRFIYGTYANTDASINGLIRILEKKGIKTATDKTYWKSSVIRRILTNTSYYGNHYFGQTEKVESKNGVSKYAKSVKTSTRIKDVSEWILVPITPIISKELFDVVQNKLKRNARLLRNTNHTYFLGGLVKCGVCGHTYSGCKSKNIKYYRCNHREKLYHHNNTEDLAKCNNQSVKSDVVDGAVLKAIIEKALQPKIIKKYIDILNNTKGGSLRALNNDLVSNSKQLELLEAKKRKVLDLYSDNLVNKEDYIAKINEIDFKCNDFVQKKQDLNRKISLLSRRADIRTSINDFCKMARRYWTKLDQVGRIGFINSFLDEVVIMKNEVENKLIISGFLPLSLEDSGQLPQYYTSDWRGARGRWRLAPAGRNLPGTSGRVVPG